MSLPTPTDLMTMKYTFLDGPFCDVAAKSSIDTTGLQYAFLDGPFYGGGVGVPGGADGSGVRSYVINT